MIQQNKDPRREGRHDEASDNEQRESKSEISAGSQAETTGYGTGKSGAQGAAPAQARSGKDTPSNAGDAGFSADEAVSLSEDRTTQMAHADGTNEEDISEF